MEAEIPHKIHTDDFSIILADPQIAQLLLLIYSFKLELVFLYCSFWALATIEIGLLLGLIIVLSQCSLRHGRPKLLSSFLL